MALSSIIFGGVTRKPASVTFDAVKAALATANSSVDFNGQELTGVAGLQSDGSIAFECAGQPIGKYESFSPGDARFSADASASYLLFAANAAGQQVLFQAVGSGGTATFETNQVVFYDGGINQSMILDLSVAAVALALLPAVGSFAIRQDDLASGTGAPMSYVAQASLSGAGGDFTCGPGDGTAGNGTLTFTGPTTGTSSPAAGGAGALPLTPKGYWLVTLDGIGPVQIPYY